MSLVCAFYQAPYKTEQVMARNRQQGGLVWL